MGQFALKNRYVKGKRRDIFDLQFDTSQQFGKTK